MAYAESHDVTVVTASNGTGTGYTPVVTGKILGVIYTKASSDAYAVGVDFDITAEDSGLIIWDEDSVDSSKTVSPRQATHDVNGVEQSTAGDVNLDFIYLAQDRVKIEIVNGGDTKTGSFKVIVGG